MHVAKATSVFLSNDYQYDFTTSSMYSDDKMHMTSFSVGVARKLLAMFDDETKPILEDTKLAYFMDIGVVLKRLLLSELHRDSEIAFWFCCADCWPLH